MPAGPGLCPRHRSWVGRDLCHPVAGPGRALGGESGKSVPRSWCSQEEQALGQQAPYPFSRARRSPVCSDWLLAQWAPTSLPWGGQESGLCSTEEGPAPSEGLGGPGEACLYPEMGGARTSDTTTFQLKLVQPKGQLLFGTPRSLL